MLGEDSHIPSVPTFVLTILLTYNSCNHSLTTRYQEQPTLAYLSCQVVRSSKQLWKAWGTPAVNESDCSRTRELHCDLGVASSRPVSHGATVQKAGVRLRTKQINVLFSAHCRLKTIIPLSKMKQRDNIILYVPDSGLQWEKQADSKWILIFPAAHCRWFLAEWLPSCRVDRGWTV